METQVAIGHPPPELFSQTSDSRIVKGRDFHAFSKDTKIRNGAVIRSPKPFVNRFVWPSSRTRFGKATPTRTLPTNGFTFLVGVVGATIASNGLNEKPMPFFVYFAVLSPGLPSSMDILARTTGGDARLAFRQDGREKH